MKKVSTWPDKILWHGTVASIRNQRLFGYSVALSIKKLKKHPRKLVKAHFQAKRKWQLGPAVEEAEQQNTRKEEAAVTGAPVDLLSFRDVSSFGPPPLGPWGGPGGAGPMALPPSQSHDP